MTKKESKPTLSLARVREMIDLDEPDYISLAKHLGAESISHLQTIVKGTDPMLASKATYLVSLMPDADASAEVLGIAAQSPHVIVRVAAASAMRNAQMSTSVAVLSELLKDSDSGVRKVALRTIESRPEIGPKDMVIKLSTNDPEESIRYLAGQLISRIP